MMRAVLPAFVLLLPAPLHAQFLIDPAHRFELGQRLRLFERALDKHGDLESRKRILRTVEEVTPAFFATRFAEAASHLDEARLLLTSTKPSDEVRWAESLIVKPASRLLDASAGELSITVQSFYRVESKKPARVSVRFTLAGKSATVELKDLPLEHALAIKDVKEGDHSLKSEVLVDDKVCAAGEQTVSIVAKLTDRLAALEKKSKSAEKKPASPEKATLKALLKTLSDLAAKKTLETNYPAARLLKEAEALEPGKRYYGPDRPGEFWLTLGEDAVRVQVPAGLKKDKPVPLVVALHGAGGSENLFFDGHGGKVAKLCADRGWLLAATRSGLFPVGKSLDVVRVVDALAKVYPIDTKKVFLVGHSMGAGLAVSTAGRSPERVAAVAALGGGGGFRSGDKVKNVPFFVGCGESDFALVGAKTLNRSLEKAGVKKVVFKQYEGVEHLTIVQLALKDVFAFFDEAAKR
jgi:predicted esterase